MKIKPLMAALAFGMVISLAGAPAAYSDITHVNFPTPLPEGNSASGPITNIDPVNRMIQLKVYNGMIESFHIDDYIHVARDGTVVQFEDLSLGDIVTVTAKN